MANLDTRIILQRSRFNLIQEAADFNDSEHPHLNRQLINTRMLMLEQNWRFQEEHENLCFSEDGTFSEHPYLKERIFERCQVFYVYSHAKLLTQLEELTNLGSSSDPALSDRGIASSVLSRSALPHIKFRLSPETTTRGELFTIYSTH